MPIVIKYGGSVTTELELRRRLAQQIASLARTDRNPVVVHGGGPYIREALEQAGIVSSFVRGLRVTTAESLPVVEQCLTMLNKRLSQEIGQAVGLTGRDSSLLIARPLTELGMVGEMHSVNTAVISRLLRLQLTPVIACLAENLDSPHGEHPDYPDSLLNVNADSVAGAVAGALESPVVFLSDVPGVLEDPSNPESLISELDEAEIREKIASGVIAGGMIPKVEAALSALKAGASFAVIADGRKPEELPLAMNGHSGSRVYA